MTGPRIVRPRRKTTSHVFAAVESKVHFESFCDPISPFFDSAPLAIEGEIVADGEDLEILETSRTTVLSTLPIVLIFSVLCLLAGGAFELVS